MKSVRSLSGYNPIVFTPDGLLLARGYRLYKANLDCSQLEPVGTIPCSAMQVAAGSWRLLQRTLRLGVRVGCRMDGNRYLLGEKSRIWVLDLDRRSLTLDHVIERGSTPLFMTHIEGVAGFDEGTCYGEYGRNTRKEPVRIWRRNPDGAWQTVYTFPSGVIKHLHALVPDKQRGVVWILSGDFEDSCGIWVARKNFTDVSPVLVGKQEFRCCWMAFLEGRCLYATDSQLQPNSLRELVLQDQGPEGFRNATSRPLQDISGSSIYACRVQDQLVFSTTVEPGQASGHKIRDFLDNTPGPGIKGNRVDIVAGDLQRGFRVLGSWPTDGLPLRLCGFGTIRFPAGTNPGPYLYAYSMGLAGCDGRLDVWDLDDQTPKPQSTA
jgi:hypothetical protein